MDSVFQGLRRGGVPFPLDAGQERLDRFRRVIDSLGAQYSQDLFYYTVRFTTLNRLTTQVKPVPIERDSAFELVALAGGASTTASGSTSPNQPVDLLLIDASSSRNLMSGAVPMTNLLGTGINPFLLPITRRFMPRTQLNVAAHNYATGVDFDHANVTFIGRKLYLESDGSPLERFNTWQAPSGRLYTEDFYSYDFNMGAIARSSNNTLTQTIERDADFEWLLTTFSGTVGDTIHTPQTAAFDIQIVDGASGRRLVFQANAAIADGGVDLADIAGTGAFPAVMWQPRLFAASSPVTITMTNNDTAQDYTNLHFTMIGRKVFALD